MLVPRKANGAFLFYKKKNSKRGKYSFWETETTLKSRRNDKFSFLLRTSIKKGKGLY
jgi:hypothetical protein